jgi:hypothetical protein
MSLTKKFTFNDVVYSTTTDEAAKEIKFEISNPRKEEKPEFLYKYFPFNRYSVDALKSGYLFGSHPMNLNDKYDCSGDLVDYSNLDLNFFIKFLAVELKMYSKEKVESLYNDDQRWILERTVADLNQTRLFMKFGVISLTEEEKDVLMWAYYAQNTGFIVKFDVSLLPENLFGPFPINYTEKFQKIDIAKYGPEMAILFQSNVKHIMWEKENEWRYVSYNPDGKFHPFYWSHDYKSRYVYYNREAVKEIILGYDFINPREIDFKFRTQESDIVNFNSKKSRHQKKLKKKLLNHIINNSISCKQIVRNRYDYLLDNKEVPIEKVSPNRFKIYNIFKQIEP